MEEMEIKREERGIEEAKFTRERNISGVLRKNYLDGQFSFC